MRTAGTLILLAFVLILTSKMSAQNLLENGDFSQWSEHYPIGWWVEDSTEARIEQSADPVRSPEYAVKATRLIRGTGSNSGIKQEYIPVEDNEPYTLSVWVYDNEDSTSGGIGFSYYDADTNYLRRYASTKYSEGASPEWQLVTRTDTTPDSTAFVRVTIRVYNIDTTVSAGGVICFDDAVFVPGLGSVAEPPARHPVRTARLTVIPNPARERTSILLEPGTPGWHRLDIFDLCGNRRATPHSGHVATEGLGVVYDGTDQASRHLPAGLYFAVLTDRSGRSTVQRLVLDR